MLSRPLRTWLSATRSLRNLWGRLRLRNRSVTVISNDCWGGNMLRYLHLPFNTPTVGLFILGPDYIRLLENPSLFHPDTSLRFITAEQSRYSGFLKEHGETAHPVALLGDTDIEIHFLHYKTPREAEEKWRRRCRRIRWDNAIVKMSERDFFTPDMARRFEALPYPVKVLFASRAYPEAPATCVALPEYRGDGHVFHCWYVSNRHWSFVGHANALLAKKK